MHIKRTRAEKLNEVLDNRIKNLEPTVRDSLFNDLITSDISDKIDPCSRHIRQILNIVPGDNAGMKNYWRVRGWNDIHAEVKSREHHKQRPKRTSPFSKEFWLKKINTDTGELYTEQEADYKRNTQQPIKKEYWINKGYSDQDAIRMAVDQKIKNNKSGANSSSNRSSEQLRSASPRTTEYWTSRGYSEEEAIKEVTDAQKLFSLDICIQNHGVEEGTKIWQGRQDRWQATLNAKSDEEKLEINRKKIYKNGVISKTEQSLATEIKKNIPDIIQQFRIKRNNTSWFIYDIIYKNKIIEFNGDMWHANPSKYTIGDKLPYNMIVEDVWAKDKEKIQTAIDNGYKVLVIWEHDFKKYKEKVIEECIQFLTA